MLVNIRCDVGEGGEEGLYQLAEQFGTIFAKGTETASLCCLVHLADEWADKLKECLPPDDVRLHLTSSFNLYRGRPAIRL